MKKESIPVILNSAYIVLRVESIKIFVNVRDWTMVTTWPSFE